MEWIKTAMDGVFECRPRIWGDERGYFVETFNEKTMPEEIRNIRFVQDNEAKSKRGVLRGLHYQSGEFAQSKLVRVVWGEVLDVVVDLRPGSPTYGQHFSLILNDALKNQLFVPRGFAHGYIVLSEEAVFAYKCDNFYQPAAESGIRYDDETLNIDWRLSPEELIISEKDKHLPLFKPADRI